MSTIRAELDRSDRWAGVRRLKTGYNPKPYHIKDDIGQPIPLKQRADYAADYLETKHWHPADAPPHPEDNRPILPAAEYDTDLFTDDELEEAIYRAKAKKTPGPDNITTEQIKALNDISKSYLLDTINIWWINKTIDESACISRVAQIYKKKATQLNSKTTDLYHY